MDNLADYVEKHIVPKGANVERIKWVENPQDLEGAHVYCLQRAEWLIYPLSTTLVIINEDILAKSLKSATLQEIEQAQPLAIEISKVEYKISKVITLEDFKAVTPKNTGLKPKGPEHLGKEKSPEKPGIQDSLKEKFSRTYRHAANQYSEVL